MFDSAKKAVRQDKSKKGSIDKEILGLVELINVHPDYYTTSSCAGRIVVIEKNRRKCDSKFLLASHGPVRFSELKESLQKIGPSPVWLKQESVIVHVSCRNIDAADKLLKIANDSGLKHSGAITLGEHIIVELVGSDMLETIVAKEGKMLLSEEYLKVLTDEANSKLLKNLARIGLLEKNLRTFLSS